MLPFDDAFGIAHTFYIPHGHSGWGLQGGVSCQFWSWELDCEEKWGLPWLLWGNRVVLRIGWSREKFYNLLVPACCIIAAGHIAVLVG
jgi:hypothetical protein